MEASLIPTQRTRALKEMVVMTTERKRERERDHTTVPNNGGGRRCVCFKGVREVQRCRGEVGKSVCVGMCVCVCVGGGSGCVCVWEVCGCVCVGLLGSKKMRNCEWLYVNFPEID